MLCVTGAEGNTEDLAERLARLPLGALAEVRLDALPAQRWSDALALVARYGQQLVVCCRPARQGGAYEGDEADRIELLAQAARQGARFVDIEADATDATLTRLRGALAPGAELMASWHTFEPTPPPELHRRVRELERRDVHRLKLAITVEEAADLERLLHLSDELRKPAVLLAMGAHGQLSRWRYASFGSPWTYVCETPALATAKGQLDLDSAHQLGLPQSAREPFFALMGGPSVAASPGPRIYNALFRRRQLPWAYLAVETAAPRRCLRLLEGLGARGVAVTMPHKAAALAHGAADALARRAGAVNSLRLDDQKAATNTDVEGVRAPLAAALEGRGRGEGTTALILGAGGAARAAALACAELGLEVQVAARRSSAASQVPGATSHLDWAQRHLSGAEVVLNATALAGDTSPWPEGHEAALRGRLVFDLALAQRPSKLLADAAEGGGRTLPPMAMWRHQGAAQLGFFAGRDQTFAALQGLDAADLADEPEAANAPISSGRRGALELPCPGSKSMTQRALLIGGLSQGPREVTIRGALPCDDSRHLSAALASLGVESQWRGDEVRLRPAQVLRAAAAPLLLGNAGTAVRFTSCLSLLCEGPLTIDGDARMRQRPLGPLLAALRDLGVAVDELGHAGCPPVRLHRMAAPPESVSVDASLSSQYASGLALVAPRLATGLTLRLLGERVSRPYLEMTLSMLQGAGAAARWLDEDTLRVDHGPCSGAELEVEADWSSASFLLGAGWLLHREVRIPHLTPTERSLQGDAVFEGFLEELSRPGPRHFDLGACPDLIAPLAALALFAESPTSIGGAAHARVKECDRIAVLARELRRLGAAISERDDGLAISPLPSELADAPAEGLCLRCEDDHRMAMAFALVSLRRRGLTVDNPACVSKSFPDFWHVWRRLS